MHLSGIDQEGSIFTLPKTKNTIVYLYPSVGETLHCLPKTVAILIWEGTWQARDIKKLLYHHFPIWRERERKRDKEMWKEMHCWTRITPTNLQYTATEGEGIM